MMSKTYGHQAFPSSRYDAWRTTPPDAYGIDPRDPDDDPDDDPTYPEHVFWPDDEPFDDRDEE
jgi:hypothetical protein